MLKRFLLHPSLLELYPGLAFVLVIAFGLYEGWGR